MSILNAKPTILQIIESMPAKDVAKLRALLDGAPTGFRSLTNGEYKISDKDAGVSHIAFETKKKTYTGYLVKNDSMCALIAHEGDKCVCLLIDPDKRRFKAVDEGLTAGELRSLLDDEAEASGDSWVDEMRSIMEWNRLGYVECSESLIVNQQLAVGRISPWTGTRPCTAR